MQALEGAGYSVWWDLHIRGGARFSQEIEREIQAATAVIVVWSEASIKSAFYRRTCCTKCRYNDA